MTRHTREGEKLAGVLMPHPESKDVRLVGASERVAGAIPAVKDHKGEKNARFDQCPGKRGDV